MLKPVPWQTQRDGKGRQTVQPVDDQPIPAGHTSTHLLDVTINGVRVHGNSFRTGDSVALVVDGFLPFRAIVAWTTLGEAGLDFRRPIHTAMVHHLARLTPRGR